MAKWVPEDKVGTNEHLGRRLFAEPLLAGALDQPNFDGLKITHFEETRDEYSLDRLGRTSVEPKIIQFLEPRAVEAGKKFHAPKPFNGWATIRAKELVGPRKPPSFDLFASPVNEAPPEDNPYHAHAKVRDSIHKHLVALHLRFLFVNYGSIYRYEGDDPSKRSLLARLLHWISRSAWRGVRLF